MFPKYNLSEKQIKGIACIVAHEQGTLAGMLAEASQIANRTDIRGDKYATAENIVKTVTSGWYAHGKSRYAQGTSNAVAIKAVKIAICNGYRTLPRYIDEHDCMSDIATVKNGLVSVKGDKSKWKQHKTIIRNKMSSKYTFYDFPGGYKTKVDPFGYTSKANRDKYGDFCFTVEEATSESPLVTRLLNDLFVYHNYIKANYKNFINKYDGDITTFAKAKTLVGKGKDVGITCVVPLRWALANLGLKNGKGLSLISAPHGSFKEYYTGDMKKYLTRITSGGAIGKTLKNAVDAKLLKKGDIVCYEDLTHTSVYSGVGYKMYEGGGACVVDGHYPNGVVQDYSKKYKNRKISEILRWKDQDKSTTKSMTTNNTTVKVGNYQGAFPALPPRGYFRLNDGITTLVGYRPNIKMVQNLVNWINDGKIAVDGQYGKKTVSAVKDAQKKLGVTQDGIFGQKTLAKCKAYTKK